MPLFRESDLVLLAHWLAQEAALSHTNPQLAAVGTAVSRAWAPGASCLLRGFISGLVCGARGIERACWLSFPVFTPWAQILKPYPF